MTSSQPTSFTIKKKNLNFTTNLIAEEKDLQNSVRYQKQYIGKEKKWSF